MKKIFKSSKENLLKKISFFLFYILLFSILLNNSFSYLDPDLGWHLKIGEQILNEKQVPSFQYYDYTLEGAKWVDHEWLFNLLTFLVYDNFGYVAVNILYALLALSVFFIINNFIVKSSFFKPNIFALYILETMGLYAMLPSLGVRMQELSILFLLLLLIIINNFSQKKNYKILFFALLLFFVWVNFHGGFILGIFIYFFWLGIKIFEKILSKTPLARHIEQSLHSTKELLIYFVFGLGIMASTFFTPYFTELHRYLSGIFSHTSYMMVISEWLPIFYLPIRGTQIIYMSIIGMVLILLSYYSLSKKYNKKINLWNFALSLLFFVLAFKSKRHFPLLFVVSLPLLVGFFSSENIFLTEHFKSIKKSLIIKIFLLAFFISTISYNIISTNFTSTPFSNEKFCSEHPCEAVDFLKKNNDFRGLKMLNNYGEGGFLIWQWPEKRLFIDGRFPQYEYAEHTILDEYLTFEDNEKVESKLKEYEIEMVLLRNPKLINISWVEMFFLGLKKKTIQLKSPLKDYLDESNKWEQVFANNLNSIYVKK